MAGGEVDVDGGQYVCDDAIDRDLARAQKCARAKACRELRDSPSRWTRDEDEGKRKRRSTPQGVVIRINTRIRVMSRQSLRAE